MDPESTVACVVANWNGGERVLSCLRSLGGSEGVAVRLILVDNGSTDGSTESVRRDFPDADVIIMEENAGLAMARNRGAAHALSEGFRYILFLDDDARVGRTTLALLLSAIRNDPRCGIATPRIYGANDTGKVWYDGGRVNWFGDPVHARPEEGAPDAGTSRESAFATGCCSIIAGEVFEKAGFLDEDFFIYSEDVDFSFRARAAGYTVLHVPGASAWHEQSTSAKQNRGKWFRDYYVTRNKLLLYGKHYRGGGRAAAIIYFFARWVTLPLAYTFIRGEWRRYAAILRGVADYYLGRVGGTYR